MTAGSLQNRAARMNRHVSDVVEAVQETCAEKSSASTSRQTPEDGAVCRKRPRDYCPKLARLVTQDPQYISENDDEEECARVAKTTAIGADEESDSEYATATESGKEDDDEETTVPPQPNPLIDSKLLSVHVKALRLEAELFPMRQLIARLMAHPTHNRRGLFNSPVDPVELNLPDYDKLITNPMDLGTVKAKLHAVAYNTREEVAQDVRLVFENACKFNPPSNSVHIAAKNLLQFFEEAYQVLRATSDPSNTAVVGLGKRAHPMSSYQSCSCLPTCSIMPQHGMCRSTSLINTSIMPSPQRGYARSASMMEVSTTSSATISEEAPATAALAASSEYDSSSGSEASKPPPKSSSPARSVSFAGHDWSTIAQDAAGEDPSPNGDIYATTKTKAGLRGSLTSDIAENPFAAPPQAEKALKRAMNVAAKRDKHSCRSCMGRNCAICQQGCLSHEPALLICTGTNCFGAKIRKGAVYYIAKDGSRQFCQRCYTNLQAVLPHTSDQIDSFGSSVRYKRDLLKRKNEEEIAEAWLTCKTCGEGVHKICSMHNEYVHSDEDYECPQCVNDASKRLESHYLSKDAMQCVVQESEYYSFVSGSEIPVRLSEVMCTREALCAESLPETSVSAFIEKRVRDCIAATKIANAEKTVSVRIISDCEKDFKVPEVVRQHFRQPSQEVNQEGVIPPAKVSYKSKAITLFQKFDGLDVCIFCMYVQEYDCRDDDFEGRGKGEQARRVYIAYLDSVEHFRPRQCRTEVFHEILVAYLATARARGYESAHIWACPPSRGNSFVFWNHPASQRTPSKERLISWYHGALSRGVEKGIITDVKSLFESSFPLSTVRCTDAAEAFNPDSVVVSEDGIIDGRMVCPPLMDGDFWVEEAVRLHGASIVRHLRSKPVPRNPVSADYGSSPALLVASLIRDRVMAQDYASPFRRPVNAAALKLKDYHKIVEKPMDLGTVYSRCLHGEYETLSDVIEDVELVFSNAMRYNPKGHSVHNMAIDTRDFFFKELNSLVAQWGDESRGESRGWAAFSNTSMSLDNLLEGGEEFDDATDVVDEKSTELFIPPSVSLDTMDTASSKAAGATTIPQSPPLQSADPPASTSIISALLPNAGRKPITHHSPTCGRKSSKAMFALMNTKLELLTGGQDAILQRMVGDDVWMMDKKNPNPAKTGTGGKKQGGPTKVTGKRRKSVGGDNSSNASDEPAAKRRRQSWLGEEVGMSVRRMRTSFFSCSLLPKQDMNDDEAAKENDFNAYISPFLDSSSFEKTPPSSRIADARHAFLEFSQYRNLEFDTLRRAKYSTAILLYHLRNDDAPGLIPSCSSCSETIQDVRWHRIRRVEERHHTGRVPPTLRAQRMAQIAVPPEVAEACHKGEELCASCFGKVTKKEEFIPLPVSFKA